jgi:hypothetical protein
VRARFIREMSGDLSMAGHEHTIRCLRGYAGADPGRRQALEKSCAHVSVKKVLKYCSA